MRISHLLLPDATQRSRRSNAQNNGQVKGCRAQSLYCAINLAKGRNTLGLAKRRNETIAPYGVACFSGGGYQNV
jgi:hypothetical protein